MVADETTTINLNLVQLVNGDLNGGSGTTTSTISGGGGGREAAKKSGLGCNDDGCGGGIGDESGGKDDDEEVAAAASANGCCTTTTETESQRRRVFDAIFSIRAATITIFVLLNPSFRVERETTSKIATRFLVYEKNEIRAKNFPHFKKSTKFSNYCAKLINDRSQKASKKG